MEKNSVCENMLWKQHNLVKEEAIALIEYLVHKEIVDTHTISLATGIPEETVQGCVSRLVFERLLCLTTPVTLSATCDHSCYYRVTDRLRKCSKHNEIALNML